MLGEEQDAVIGVDTHRDTHTAALVDMVGRQLAVLIITADAAGYARLLAWLAEHVPGGRVLWAIEGTRSHGAGLCRALAAAGAQITEVDRPTRRSRRAGKSDPVDALLAARAALAASNVRRPRADGDREAARLLLVERDRLVRHRTAVLNQMRDLVLTAPQALRQRLRDRSIAGLIAACSSLRSRASDDIETRVRVQSLRRRARRAHAPTEDAKTVETDLKDLTATNVPHLLAEPGIGPIVAAQLWVSWSHPGRIPCGTVTSRSPGVCGASVTVRLADRVAGRRWSSRKRVAHSGPIWDRGSRAEGLAGPARLLRGSQGARGGVTDSSGGPS